MEHSLHRAGFYERNRRLIGRGVLYVTLFVLLILFMLPVYWLISVSLKTPETVVSIPVEFWPKAPKWENYLEVWRRANVPRYMFNSVFLASMYTILTVASSSMVGYGFARFKVAAKKPLFNIVLATIIMPPMVFMIPHFLLFNKFKLLNTYWPWVLYGLAGSGFHIFLFRQFFSSFPQELAEAAELDGCGPVQTFLRIMVPNAKAAFAAGAIFAFQWNWSDYLQPRLYLQESKFTFAVALYIGLHPPYTPENAPDFPVQMAGAVFFALPLLLVFFFAQKYIIKGVVTSGLKG